MKSRRSCTGPTMNPRYRRCRPARGPKGAGLRGSMSSCGPCSSSAWSRPLSSNASRLTRPKGCWVCRAPWSTSANSRPIRRPPSTRKRRRGLLIGNYLILDKLGQGGMGVVFKARHRASGRVGALKILPPSFARDKDAVSRFRREIEAAGRLNHPNVVAAIDSDEDRGVHFLVMDYVSGPRPRPRRLRSRADAGQSGRRLRAPGGPRP